MSSYEDTVLVTGGTTGVGYHIARLIAKRQPKSLVIIASRSSANDAAGKINRELGQSNVKYLPLDLMSLATIREFASTIVQSEYPPISALLLNAGLQFPGPVEYNKDKVEKTFAVNHLGNALVFYLLKSHLKPDAGIVVTSSGTHDPDQKTGLPDAKYTTGSDLAHPDEETAVKDGRQRYSTSKLCNIIWTYALDRRIKAAGNAWTVVAVDPGLMPGTGLARLYPAPLRWTWNHILPHLTKLLRILVHPNIHTAEESGTAITELAIGKVDGLVVSGTYYEGTKAIKSSKESYDQVKQEDLWDFTINTLAKDESEAGTFQV